MTPSDTPPSGDDPGVLSGLSRTRPQRRSNKRPGPAPDADEPGSAGKAGKPVKATSAKPRKPATARAGASRAKGPTAASRTKSATASPAKAKAGSSSATHTVTEPVIEVGRVADPGSDRPPVTAERQGGADLVGQAIQAAGEVAQLGVGITRQVAKSILSRLPKP